MSLAYALYLERREAVLRTSALLAAVGAEDTNPDVLGEVTEAFEAADPVAARRTRRTQIMAALAACG
ncbi:hypothetical protein AB0J28_00680 [Streptosporangium canum]|uniref:hypothetical protein n=1 Tax=Streptosporangium canum TaxID=324952 RepID=UPI0034162744